MLKTKLTKIVEQFFAIGDSHNLSEYMEIREQLLNLITEDELFLNTTDKNFTLAMDIISFIDSDKIFGEVDFYIEAGMYESEEQRKKSGASPKNENNQVTPKPAK